MKLKKCGCKWCRRGMRCRQNSEMITRKKRSARHKAKQDLKKGKEPEKFVKIPYTS